MSHAPLDAIALAARVREAEAFAREIATNYDHDTDAHRYDTPCRVCMAEAFLGRPCDECEIEIAPDPDAAERIYERGPGCWKCTDGILAPPASDAPAPTSQPSLNSVEVDSAPDAPAPPREEGFIAPQQGVRVPTRREVADLLQRIVDDAGGDTVSQPLAETFAQYLDAIYAQFETGTEVGERAPTGSCLVCGQLRPFAVWVDRSLTAGRPIGACARCRDARNVVSGGATYETPRTPAEFLAAGDRVMQHYLGDHAPSYGDARFLFDYGLGLEDRVRQLSASPAQEATPPREPSVSEWITGIFDDLRDEVVLPEWSADVFADILAAVERLESRAAPTPPRDYSCPRRDAHAHGDYAHPEGKQCPWPNLPGAAPTPEASDEPVRESEQTVGKSRGDSAEAWGNGQENPRTPEASGEPEKRYSADFGECVGEVIAELRAPEASAPEPERLALVARMLAWMDEHGASLALGVEEYEVTAEDLKAILATVAALTAERDALQQQLHQQNAGGTTEKSEPLTAAAPNQPQEPELKGESMVRNDQPITLGALIDLLAAREQDQTVRFDFGYIAPTGVSSYRGYYDHLAIEYADERDVKVADFLAQLREAVGSVYIGWKGGDFRMTRNTPLWVANPGNSGGTCVLGLHDECKYQTIIATGYCEDWEGNMGRALELLEGLGFGNAHR
jgi:hypothetical protein